MEIKTSLTSKNEELQKFCDALETYNIVCDKCKSILKKKIHVLCVDNPNHFVNANVNDIEGSPDTSLHSLCVVRIIAHYRMTLSMPPVAPMIF